MSSELSTRIASNVNAAADTHNKLAIAAALNSVAPDELAVYFHSRLLVDDDTTPVGEGLAASPGGASGTIVLSAVDAIEASDRGESVILVRRETTPDDVLGMQLAKGVLTSRGGLVSHAAVVARGWGIPAVVGASDVTIDGTTVTIGTTVLQAGDSISIDGTTGAIYAGEFDVSGEEEPPELQTLLAWADDVARGAVEVRVNADTAADAAHGRSLGAQGIGLCRTEHMFLAADRLPIVRRFILADDSQAEAKALAELEEVQVVDFEGLLDAMNELPVTIRLLDPPLHEFLPDMLDLVAAQARGTLNEADEQQLAAVQRLHESNPMIGTRGVRLGMLRSGLYEMQVRAVARAAANLFEQGKRPHVEIMIPLVVEAKELAMARSWVTSVLDEIGHPELESDVITIGAMIETPRAAVTAGALAEHADFFSFGTNDLTQMTYAFSRDDVEAHLIPHYIENGILSDNPFAVLDQDGVGELLRHACEHSRAARPTIKLGICGEHAGHPESAAFVVRLGVDSVSCSPFRVPMARLGVAQALLLCGRVHIDNVSFSEPETAAAAAASAAETASGGLDGGAPLPDITPDLVLHVLRLKGFITTEGLHASLGTVPTGILDALVADGLTTFMEARSMYMLAPAGRERHAEIASGLISPDQKAALADPYHRFLVHNDELKELCSAWQMRGDQPNDHSDAQYDAECLSRLDALNRAVAPVLAECAATIERLARYQLRLDEAVAAVQSGNIGRFTGVMCESYHDIWMELHEDLILIQGIDRAAEGSF